MRGLHRGYPSRATLLASGLEFGEEELLVHVVEDGDARDCQQHADGAKHAATHDDANQDQEAGHAERAAKEPRLDQVAVTELQHGGEYEEHDGEPQLDEGEYQGADDGTNQRAKGGNQVEDGHDEGHQPDVGNAHHGHEQRVRPTDDQAVEQVVDDVAVEDRVATAQEAQGGLVLRRGEDDAEQALGARLEMLLLEEEVDGEEDGDRPLDDALARERGRVQDDVRVLPQDVRQGVEELLAGGEQPLQVEVGPKQLQLGQARRRLPRILGQVLDEGRDAIDELADSIRQFGIISPLLVQKKDGTIREVRSGEVSVRGLYSYV